MQRTPQNRHSRAGKIRRATLALCALLLSLSILSCGCRRQPDSSSPPSTTTPASKDMSCSPIHLVITVDPPQVHLARNTLLTIEAIAPQNVEVQIPPLADRIQGFLVSDSSTSTLPGEKNETILRVTAILTPLLAEEYRIAPMPISWKDNRQTPPSDHWFPTPEWILPSAHSQDKTGTRFHDLVKATWIYPSFRTVVFWILGASALAGFLYLLWKLSRRVRRHIRLMMMSPRERALVELAELLEKKLIEQNLIKQFYIELTFVVRRYIERSYRIRAPEQTTEEFLRSASDDPRFSPEVVTRLSRFLQSADMVKFAAVRPDKPTVEQAVQSAREYIETDSTPGQEQGKGGRHV